MSNLENLDSIELPLFEGWSPFISFAEYDGNTWSYPVLKKEHNISIPAGAMALQFGASIFEGLVARSGKNNTYHLFREDENFKRFCKSADRLCLNHPPKEIFYEALEMVVGEIHNWNKPFSSDKLYIRPVLYGIDNHLMPVESQRLIFIIFVAPIRAYNPKSLSLKVEYNEHRAVEGGLGNVKTASNYAHQFNATKRVKADHYTSVLWLSACKNKFIEEASTMNVFFLIGGEVITPKLNSQILPGITRKSIIDLIVNDGIKVIERDITLDEVVTAHNNGQLKEMFVSSTALGVRHVDILHVDNTDLKITSDHSLSSKFSKYLLAIQKGEKKYKDWTSTINFHEVKNNSI